MPPPSFWQWVKNLDIQGDSKHSPAFGGVIITRRGPFLGLGGMPRGQTRREERGREWRLSVDRHRRPILRREGEPFVGRSYPADADAPAKGGAVLRKVVLKTGGWQGFWPPPNMGKEST